MKTKVIKISLIIGLLLLAFLIFKIGPKQILENIKSVSLAKFLILIAISIGEWVLHIYVWKIVIDRYDGEVSFLNLYGARMAGYSVSYLTPTAFLGGEPVRAMMVKCSNKKKSAASVVVDRTIHMFAMLSSIIIAIIIAVIRLSLPKEIKIVFIAFIFVSIVFATVILVKQNQGFFMWLYRLLEKVKIKIRFLEKNKGNIEEIDNYVSDFYKNHRKIFLIVFILNCFIVLYFAGEIFLTLKFMEVEGATFLKAFLVMTLGNLTILLPYIPASMGTYETANVLIFIMLGLGAAAGLTLTLIRRIISFIWAGTGLFIIGRAKK